jgi:phosphotransferase system HPr (HPr) family protein
MESSNQGKATRTVTVANRAGLHARAALLVAKCARGYPTTKVELVRDRYRVEATDMLQMLSLGAQQGQVLALEATGADAEAALDALATLFAAKFHEEDADTTP